MKTLKTYFIIIVLFCLNSNLFSNPQIDKIKELTKIALEINSSNHLKALQICDSVLELCKKNNYLKGEAKITRIKGLAMFYAVDYSRALELYIQSKNMFEKLKDTIGISQSNNNIAIVYDYLNLYEKALYYHKENLKLRTKINDINGISTTLNNIGVVFSNIKQNDSSLYYYKKALEIQYKINDTITLSRYLNNIGNIYIELNKFDSAYFYLKKSLSIGIRKNDFESIKDSYQGLGSYYFKIGNYSEARKNQELSLKFAYQTGIVYEIESISEELSKTYEKLGLFELAYKNSVLNKRMHDSINLNGTTSLITKIELEKAFEVEKRIHELESENKIQKEKSSKIQLIFLISALLLILLVIIYSFIKIRKSHKLLLENQNEIIRQKEELEKINSEKDKLFSIVAHDLKSPFTGFLMLTNMLVKNNESMSKSEILDKSISLKESAENLYRLLENLLEWSLIQRDLIKFNPETCILDLTLLDNILLQSEAAKLKEIELINNIPQDLLVIADAEMLNIIVRNLISNAIKFTNRTGKIEIDAIKNEENIVISIKDNGIGISDQIKDKIFKIEHKISNLGTENEPSTGLGLLLVKEFVEKNNGKLWFESKVNVGSTFYFTLLPISNP